MKEVQEWFDDWNRKTNAFQLKFDNAVYQSEANKLKSTVSLHVTQAEINFSQRSYDRALESVTQATESLDSIRQNEPVMRVAGVEKFVQETEAKLKEMKDKFNATIFQDAIRQKTSDAERVLSSAKLLLERHAHAKALEDYNSAKEAIEELRGDSRFNTQPSVISFLEKIDKEVREFSTKYASSQLQDEARQHVNNVKAELSLAKTYLDRGAGDEAYKHLVEARAKAQALTSNDMFQTLEQVPVLLSELSKTEELYAQKELTKSADEFVRAANAHLKQVAQFEKVQAKAKAVEQLQEAEKAAQEVLDNPLYASIASVKTFKEEFKTTSERLKYKRVTGATSTGGKGSGASSNEAQDTTTAVGIVGGLLPYPDLRLKPVTVSTDINPKIFNAVKKL